MIFIFLHCKYYPAAYFQAINIPLGSQGYSATFCCPYFVKKKPWNGLVSAEKRTLGSIIKLSREFRVKLQSVEATWYDAKNYEWCGNEPLFDCPYEMFILDLILTPELHIFLEITNKIFKLLNKKWS